MERIGPIGDGALAALLARAPLTPEKVSFAWRLAVGPAIERASAVELRHTHLVVRVTEPAWAREIARARGIILARMQRLLGTQTVSALEVPDHREGSARPRRH